MISTLSRPGTQASLPRADRKPFHNPRLHRLITGSRMLRSMSMGVLARLEIGLLGGHKETSAIRTIQAARAGRESLQSGNEAFMVYSIAKSQRELGGEMAEVGVYQGVSAKLISMASGGAPLHLFDTFAGLPAPECEDGGMLHEGRYAASLASVRAFLADCTDINLYPGLFPASSGPCEHLSFSFVHLDVDLRAGTRDCLAFFYPRMLRGGIILLHDYSYLDGVRHAVDDFFADRPERPIELATPQAMLVKL